MSIMTVNQSSTTPPPQHLSSSLPPQLLTQIESHCDEYNDSEPCIKCREEEDHSNDDIYHGRKDLEQDVAGNKNIHIYICVMTNLREAFSIKC